MRKESEKMREKYLTIFIYEASEVDN